jgi:hypothetical protein
MPPASLKPSVQVDSHGRHSIEYIMLEALIKKVTAEHATGDKAHWGAEDRRAMFRFIVMDRKGVPKLSAFQSEHLC